MLVTKDKVGWYCTGTVRIYLLGNILYVIQFKTIPCKIGTHKQTNGTYILRLKSIVVDPDPYVFGPPGSGSGSDHSMIKKNSKKTLNSTVLRLFYDFLS
jgi:hypothetical protein